MRIIIPVTHSSHYIVVCILAFLSQLRALRPHNFPITVFKGYKAHITQRSLPWRQQHTAMSSASLNDASDAAAEPHNEGRDYNCGARDWKNTIGKSAKPFVSGIASLVILCNASVIPVYYVLFGVLNSTLSKVLKYAIREPRPSGAAKGGYGMPSSHAQSVSYFATILSLNLYSWISIAHISRRFQASLMSSQGSSALHLMLDFRKLLVVDALLYATCTSMLTSYCYYAW